MASRQWGQLSDAHELLEEHQRLTRRYLLQLATCGLAVSGANWRWTQAAMADTTIPEFGSFLTPAQEFRDVSRGKPIPHTLSADQLRSVGLTRDTWQLEVVSDPDHPAKLGRSFTKANGTAFDFEALMRLAEQRAVRFAKVMTCLNIGCPLGMGVWEGVPLRDVIWMTQPREDLRRVFYFGFHNDDPEQKFLSSLPIARVLEDPFDLPPVILCYKLNGEWLDAQRGGPVRVVVPEAYGFKSIKWLSHVVLTNLAHANDTYAAGNNDVDSPLKTFAATLTVPIDPKVGAATIVTGYAQVGISGLSKVQYCLMPADQEWPEDDRYFAAAPWKDCKVLGPPEPWSKNDAAQQSLRGAIGFNQQGHPQSWPMRLAQVHWVAVVESQPAGEYTFRCRTIDEKGITQPLPRPMRKSGHAAIEEVTIRFVST